MVCSGDLAGGGELGLGVAFGVLLDTRVVRSLLVPALAHDLGGRVWWPSLLGRSGHGAGREVREPAGSGAR